MAAKPQITAKELAEEAGLPIQCLDKIFHEENAHLLAEFCHPWENISYHLKLTKVDISTIKNDKETTELRIAMLETWSEKFAHKATYRVLIEALIQSKHAKQALNLCRKIKGEIPGITDNDKSNGLSLFSTAQRATDCHETTNEELVPNTDIAQSIDQLSMRFICIQNRFLQSGSGSGVTLEQLKTCISTLPSFTTDNDPELLLKAESLDLFIFNLKRYCCALNPDILEGLIAVLGDVETKSKIKEYNKDLHDFRHKTKIKDFIGNYEGPTPPEFKDVQLKLGDNWREKTLADLKLINSQISRQAWLVKMASIGSIYVTFMIPQEDDLELGIHLRNYLQSQCVLQILVQGVCIFSCEGM